MRHVVTSVLTGAAVATGRTVVAVVEFVVVTVAVMVVSTFTIAVTGI